MRKPIRIGHYLQRKYELKKFWILFAIAALFPFQNCSSGGGGSSYGMLNQNSLSASCANTSEICLDPGSGDPNALQLRLDSWTSLNVSSTTKSITLTGVCADGGFPKTRIYWELDDATGKVITTSLLKGIQTGCSQGAFSEIISGFTNAAGGALFTPGTQLQLRLLLNGINAQGSLVYPTNPAQASGVKPLVITQ